MKTTDLIPQITHHPELADLQNYDFPAASITEARAVLTGKAMIGDDLACFFSRSDHTGRFVVLFRRHQGFMPTLGGCDMRDAEEGATYQVSVFVSSNFKPIVDRAERVREFT